MNTLTLASVGLGARKLSHLEQLAVQVVDLERQLHEVAGTSLEDTCYQLLKLAHASFYDLAKAYDEPTEPLLNWAANLRHPISRD